jgi:predicted RNA-binding Zn-ribbon protein involved in translation (DUF1610 family)
MAEKLPRRMMRFNRNRGEEAPQGYTDVPQFRETIRENPSEENGQIPSMEYEDVASAKKSEADKKKQVQQNLEKIALTQVEKFKKQHNRMPNKEEADQMAESLYSQFKNTDLENISPEEGAENKSTEGGEHRDRRHRHLEEKQRGVKQNTAAQNIPIQKEPANISNDLKSLLGDEEKKGKKSAKDEFDLGLDEDTSQEAGSEELSGIEEIEAGEKSVCPNCGKETAQIIFCSKCGTAFCDKCSKIEGEKYICPKCGAKNEA